jgi:glucokinase
MHSMNMHIRTPVPLAAQILARHGLPAYLDNDVHAATTAELRFGAGRSASEFIYLNVGTGIAAGVVTHGRLVRGASNYAGEIGHLVVEPAGVPCMCGQRGCLEPTASGGGIVEQATARALADAASLLHVGALAGTLTAHDVFAAADAGDPAAGDIAGRAMRALGNTLVGLVNLLNPELVVVGGGVFGDGWLLPRLRDHVTTYALRNAVRALRGIIPSELSIDQVGLLGAASLAWERQP